MLPLRLRGGALGSWLACALALVGCAQLGLGPKVADFSEASHDYRSADYGRVYDSWTRHEKLVGDVGTVIEAWATYKSWDFRQAYVAKYAGVYKLSDGDRATLLRSQLEASRAAYEFHVAVQTTTDKWNDLERKNTPWRLTLVDTDGTELGPTSIQVVKLPELYESEFFPNRTEFTRSYEISFVRPGNDAPPAPGSATGRLILRVASPAGQIELVWDAR